MRGKLSFTASNTFQLKKGQTFYIVGYRNELIYPPDTWIVKFTSVWKHVKELISEVHESRLKSSYKVWTFQLVDDAVSEAIVNEQPVEYIDGQGKSIL